VPNFKNIREQLLQAERVASDLETVAALDQSLASQAKANISKAKESQILQKMAELPIENMRDATESRVRTETLRKFGITNVASVYLSTEEQLERISGISEEAAKELKFIAEQMYAAISDSISYGIKIENLTVDDLNLLENVQGLELIRSDLRGNHTRIKPLAEKLKNSIAETKPLKSRIRWIFAGADKRNKALDAISNIAMVLGEPTTMVLADLAKQAFNHYESKAQEPVVEDFKKRSSDYYAVLEDVGGGNLKVGHKHFDEELIGKIEAENLDTSLIKATLRKYQIFGGKFALTQNRVILGDEMGLGKTMQALMVLSQRKSQGAERFLVVCPASVLVNWAREIESRSDLNFVKIHGEEQKSGLALWRSNAGVGLTTFDTLKAFDLTDDEIQALGVDTVVVDEAHYVKNMETGRTRTITRWLDRSPRVLFMTGTPLENRVSEFINLTSLLDINFSKQLNHAALSAGPDAFRHHAAPIYLRRNANEVLKELPELIEIREYCTWDGADYESYVKATTSGNFMGMRRAGMMPVREGVKSSKMERLLEIAGEAFAGGQKVIVFSYFKDVLNVVSQALGDRALGPITGSVSPQQRQALVDTFTQSTEPLALVGQIQAAGTGLNIQAASVVIICEPQVKPSLEVQAIARAHRMGQVRSVQVHRLLIPEGIDDLMTNMLARKQEEFDAYARDSALANSSVTAKDVDEESIAKVFVLEERKRLGIESKKEITIDEDD
jgi:SNF2 family DNA or RNA helicase